MIVGWLKKDHKYNKFSEFYCFKRIEIAEKMGNRKAVLFWTNCHLLYGMLRG